MTDFAEKRRYYCRNDKCRTKLPAAVANKHEAFCCRGCYESFHLHRCRVCEKTLEDKYRKSKPGVDGIMRFRKVANSAPTCGSKGCKEAWRKKAVLGRFSLPKGSSGYQGSQKANLCKETAAAEGLFSASKAISPGKRWVVIAGPEITPDQMRGATVPDGEIVNGVPTWEGGQFERTEAKNSKALEAYFDKLDSEAKDNCKSCGKDEDLADRKAEVEPYKFRWTTLCRDCFDRKHANG